TLHAGLQLKVAELHNRNMCEYTYNFKENPLLGAGINRQLAESFRDGNRSTKPPLAVPSLRLVGRICAMRDCAQVCQSIAGQKTPLALGHQRALKRGLHLILGMQASPSTCWKLLHTGLSRTIWGLALEQRELSGPPTKPATNR
ncbi:Uncharacterized protein SCF082_LOCUS32643, partial [Durusdinium trenchii]